MAKIIANCLCPFIFAHISFEQFSFLKDRQIHEAIGTAQEVMHSIKTKKLEGMILNVDLSKAFDRECWLYLRILLTHLGFPLKFISWIIFCITKVSFSALINGLTSPFFHAERELIEGCPLSSLLVLLTMEGLSRLIFEERCMGHIHGIKVTNDYTLAHLLFVDDVLLLLSDNIGDLTYLHSIGYYLV